MEPGAMHCVLLRLVDVKDILGACIELLETGGNSRNELGGALQYAGGKEREQNFVLAPFYCANFGSQIISIICEVVMFVIS
jgi:hypothetical protein